MEEYINRSVNVNIEAYMDSLRNVIFIVLVVTVAMQNLWASPYANQLVVKAHPLPFCFSALGMLVADQEVKVTSRISGYLKSIEITEGQRVKKGQLLAVIDEANVNGTILAFKAKVNQASSALKDAVLDKNKFSTLFNSGSVSENQYRKVLLAHDLAVEQLAASQANLEVANSQLAYTHILSPIDGSVTELYQHAGDLANPGGVIARIETIQRLELKAEIPERYISKIAPGDNVTLTIDAMQGSPAIESLISRITPSSAGGTHTFQVFITPLDPINALPGMFGRARFFIGVENKIVIPKNVIVEHHGLQGIFIAKEGGDTFRWLRLGDVRGDGIEVLAGLRENETISLASKHDTDLFNNLETTHSIAVKGGRCL